MHMTEAKKKSKPKTNRKRTYHRRIDEAAESSPTNQRLSVLMTHSGPFTQLPNRRTAGNPRAAAEMAAPGVGGGGWATGAEGCVGGADAGGAAAAALPPTPSANGRTWALGAARAGGGGGGGASDAGAAGLSREPGDGERWARAALRRWREGLTFFSRSESDAELGVESPSERSDAASWCFFAPPFMGTRTVGSE